MSDLRARLAGKPRRRTTVSVAVEDTAGAVAAAGAAQQAWMFRQARDPGGEETERLEQEWLQAKAAVAGCYVELEFQACTPVQFEALQTDFTGADGGIDPVKLDENLPALIAASAVDEDLRDVEFWRDQILGPLDDEGRREGGSWTHGEKISLGNRLLNLNLAVLDERIPFA